MTMIWLIGAKSAIYLKTVESLTDVLILKLHEKSKIMLPLYKRMTIRFALSLLRRDWRAGDVRNLFYAATLAVTCVTTVAFFIDRIQQALDRQASELLAGDVRLSSDHAIDNPFLKKARELGLQVAQFQTFRSMVSFAGKPMLVEVKVVDDAYPLRGQFVLKDEQQQAAYLKTNKPAADSIWVDARLRQQLGLHTGDTLQLGNSVLRVSAYIEKEPDRAGDMFSIAPRVMISDTVLEETGLKQEGSRIRYFLLLAGKPLQINKFKKAVTSLLKRGQRIESVLDARNEIRTAMQRARQFFGLVAVVSVLLSMTAIAISARRYAERNTRVCAILRCLGAKQTDITSIFLIQLFVLGATAGVLGIALGWISHFVLAFLIGQLLLMTLPAASLWPVIPGMLIGIFGVIMVALPPLLHLKNVPALTVLRQSSQSVSVKKSGSYVISVVLVCALIYWLADDVKMAGILIAGLVATLLLLFVLALGLLLGLRLLSISKINAWGMGLRNLTRNPMRNVSQIMAFGVAMMAVLLLTMVRSDILSLWQDTLPDDVPNRFIIGIQASQLDQISDYFLQQGRSDIEFYPVVRARIATINGKEIDDENSTMGDDVQQSSDQQNNSQESDTPKDNSSRQHRELMQHEYKLSWSTVLQKDNEIVQGQWWGKEGLADQQFSVEERMATSLGLKIGDVLGFDVAGQTLSAKVTSIRSVKWDSFKPNFYVLTPPGVLKDYPVSYITSIYLSDQQDVIGDGLVAQFPNLTIINVSALIKQVRDITSRVSMAVEYMFVLTLITGIVLLLAAVQVSYDQRRQETAVLRALGASRRLLSQSVIAEFSLLGAVSGVVAVLFAAVTAHILAAQLFQQEYYPTVWYWFVAIVGGAIGTGLLGYYSLRSIVNVSPLRSLRGD